MPNELVWYVSYASNLSRDRFLCYILGDMASGSNYAERGCDDKTLPFKDEGIQIPFELYFGGKSLKWGGGKAFVRQHETFKTYARAYLVTYKQFMQIVEQENFTATQLHIPTSEEIRSHRSLIIGNGDYSRMVYCGDHKGAPMFTFTGTHEFEINKPQPNYLKTINIGLSEVFNFTPAQGADYLLGCAGVKDFYSKEDLINIFK